MSDHADKARKAKKRNTVIIVGAAALVALGLGAWLLLRGDGSSEAAADAGPLTVEAANGTVAVAVQAISVAEPIQSVTLRNRAAGYVRWTAAEGAAVAAGDPVVVMDDGELRSALSADELALQQARINLEKARSAETRARTELDSKRSLFAAKAATQEQVDAAAEALASAEYARRAAEVSVEQSALSLERARAEFAAATLRAPFAGLVARSAFQAGDFAPANSQIVSVVDSSRILFRAEVDEYDIGKVRTGLPATITVPALEDRSFRARVELISPSAEVVNSIAVFRVGVVVDNAELELRPGMGADVVIQVSSQKGVVIPLKAVTTVRDRSYVDVVGEDGTVETVRVEIGTGDGRNVVVTEGLEAGALVVLPGAAPVAAPAAADKSSTGTSIIPISVPGSGGGTR
ncbi:MAG: efflux RND transporter periplasmic adaptor subunit [Spirochaetia bacterium]|nr:efflux RND transporter periplasmic adaptor subunit [Spirochaetia bacterium]